MRNPHAVPEAPESAQRTRVSRRGFLTTSVTAAAVFSLTDSTGYQVLTGTEQRDTESTPPIPFDELPEGESIVRRPFTLHFREGDRTTSVSVCILDPFTWRVDGRTYDVPQVRINQQNVKPDDTIKLTGLSIKDCAGDIVPTGNKGGIDLHTTVGNARIARPEFTGLIWKLARPNPVEKPQEKTSMHLRTLVTVKPNGPGQQLFDAAQTAERFALMFSNQKPTVVIPDAVTFHFVSDTPPPVLEAQEAESPKIQTVSHTITAQTGAMQLKTPQSFPHPFQEHQMLPPSFGEVGVRQPITDQRTLLQALMEQQPTLPRKPR